MSLPRIPKISPLITPTPDSASSCRSAYEGLILNKPGPVRSIDCRLSPHQIQRSFTKANASRKSSVALLSRFQPHRPCLEHTPILRKDTPYLIDCAATPSDCHARSLINSVSDSYQTVMSLASMTDKIIHGHRAVSPPPAHGLRPVPEVDEASVPLSESFSSTQSASPPPSARPPAQSFHRREAYHRVPSDGAVDLSSFDGGFSPGPLYRQSSMASVGEGSFFLPPDAGIESRSPRRSFARVPVGSKTSSPDTPRSFHRFMDTPRMGTASPDLTRSLTQSPETSPRKATFFGGLRNSISQPKSAGEGPSFFKKWFPTSWGSRSTAKESPLYSAGRNDRGGHVHENESLPGPHPHRDGKTYDQVRLESLDRSKRSASPDDIEEDDDDRPLHARYSISPSSIVFRVSGLKLTTVQTKHLITATRTEMSMLSA